VNTLYSSPLFLTLSGLLSIDSLTLSPLNFVIHKNKGEFSGADSGRSSFKLPLF